MHIAMASATCLLLETTTRSFSSSPCFSIHKLLRIRNNEAAMQIIPSVTRQTLSPIVPWTSSVDNNDHQLLMSEMYMILEIVSERVEMHESQGVRMNNLHMLLLSSVNMMTLAATAISGLAGTSDDSHFALNMSSFLLFIAATGMLMVMNGIQPSQLAEMNRHATRMFMRIERETKSLIGMGKATRADVERMMDKILMLDKAYPVAAPRLEVTEKYPSEFAAPRWWPDESFQKNVRAKNDGWNATMETQLMDIIEVLKVKDTEEYEKLGSIALKLNKSLAISGLALTSIAALGSAFASSDSMIGFMSAAAAVVGGALACAVNSIEHGGQVGMVVEMYRNKVGELKQMEEWMESGVASKRENGEVFEKMVALKLGRSLPELRNLARKSSNWSRYGTIIDEVASKLF